MGTDICVRVSDVDYPSLSALARAFELSRNIISRRYQAGYRGGDLVKPPKAFSDHIAVTVEGDYYSSLSALAKAYQLRSSMICNRYRAGKRGKELIVGSPLVKSFDPAKQRKVVSAPRVKGKTYSRVDTNTPETIETTKLMMW